MRKLYWYISAFLKKHGWIILVSLIVAIALFSILIPLLNNKINFKKRQYIGLIGEYTLDNLPPVINEQISYGLMTVRPTDHEIIPALAEDYEASPSGDFYTFTLKSDLTWQDGTPLTVDDINYNLPNVTTSKSGQEISYQLPAPFSPFLTNLTKPLIRLTDEQQVIGTSDYRIVGHSFKDQSNNKLREIIVESPTEKLFYRIYLTQEQAILALKKGEVDHVYDLSSPRELETWHNIQVEEISDEDRYLGLFFNLNDGRFVKNVRQAFAYAITKGETGKRALSPISAKSWAYFRGSKPYDKNLDKAIERLSSELPGEPLDITLTTTSQNYPRAERIKNELEELGEATISYCQKNERNCNQELVSNAKININIITSNFPDVNNYEMLLIGQEIPLDPDQYPLWHSNQPNNITHYKNTRVDALLENGRQVTEQNERTSIYQEFQQVFLEDSPVVFLEYLTKINLHRLNLEEQV